MATPQAIQAVLDQVVVTPYGTAVAVNAVEGDDEIVVDDVDNFDLPEGKTGDLDIDGVPYVFTGVDEDTRTIFLADTLDVDAATGATVSLLAATGPAQKWEALVFIDDAPEPVPAVIPIGLVPHFSEGDAQSGSAVSIVEDGSGYQVASRTNDEASLDGADVWNPNVSRTMTTLTIPDDTWTQIDAWTTATGDGVAVSGGQHTVQYRGPYFIAAAVGFASNTSGRRAVRIVRTPIDGTGAVIIAQQGSSADNTGATYSAAFTQETLEVGDIITVEAKQTSGAGLPMVVGPQAKFLMNRVSV